MADKTLIKEYLKRLDSAASHDRLTAARALSAVATPAYRSKIQAAYARETVSFVRRSLAQTLARLDASPNPEEEEEVGSEIPVKADAAKGAYWKAVDWITGTLLHEIYPRLGSIEYEANKINSSPDSRLQQAIDSLKSLLDGIEDLRAVTVSTTLKEFNLARKLKSCASTLGVELPYQLIFDGRDDLIAVGDPNLLGIAFCNGLRNAIEASGSIREVPVIVIGWGETDVDFWVTIVDQGPGIGRNSQSAFEIGSTTKRGHKGFGLAIARQAMLTIDGSITLKSNGGDGAVFELRWFK